MVVQTASWDGSICRGRWIMEVRSKFTHLIISFSLELTLVRRFHRSMTRPYFSRDRITHFDIFDRHSEHALNKLAERVRDGVAVDIQVGPVCRWCACSIEHFLNRTFSDDLHSTPPQLSFLVTTFSLFLGFFPILTTIHSIPNLTRPKPKIFQLYSLKLSLKLS
jgi:hypothetical protein